MLKKIQRSGKLPEYRTIGCTRTKNQSKWCNRMCVPIDGMGECGRFAPHAMKSNLQKAIAAHKAKLLEAKA